MSLCDKNLSFEDKELDILRNAVDSAEELAGKQVAQSPEVKEIIAIVEDFLRRKKLICYGGTAINNILPEQDQFYNKDIEIPDYDFLSPNALDDAKELADIYYSKGYTDVESKSGVHHGTYKVFVNYIPVADITYIEPHLFKNIQKEAIKRNGIYYCPPNYLRMAMYLELSRPQGDVSRWEKVLKRLTLLNKHYPLKNPRCNQVDFLHDYEGNPADEAKLYSVVRNSMIDQGLVFIGGYATSLYGKYMPKFLKKKLRNVPEFDVLAEDPKTASIILKENLESAGFKNIKVYKKPGIGEIIAPHYEIVVDKDTVCFIYEPLACHSYNEIRVGNQTAKIATIDTLLSFFLAFIYADRPYYDHEKIICMAQYLFQVQEKNRLEQKGLLKRFSLNCYGKQATLESIRAEKAEKFKELANKKGTKEYEEYFLRYIPSEIQAQKEKKTSENKTKKLKKNKRKTRKNKNKSFVKKLFNL